MEYHVSKTVDGSFAEVEARTRDALAAEGFGIMSEIDVKAKMQEKLGIEYLPQVILGACNPPLAHAALTAEEHLAVLLPCNVVVRKLADDRIMISAMNALLMGQLIDNPKLAEVAAEVAGKLQTALDQV